MLVYVLNKHGEPLMPCTPSKARKLLKQNKAKVINRTPFTIQLLYGSSGYKQNITLGIDSGSKVVGLSASTKNQELYSGELILRNNIVVLLSTRKQNRKTRRNRLRYRKERFMNRTSTKKEGWIAPSIRHKINGHIKIIDKIHKILPINKIIVEVASFDIQKINNPDINGVEYQQGECLGFWNIREYVLFRDGHTCQHCKGKSKDKILNVHHIESRKVGGDSKNNLITLCETCHDKYHKGKIELKVKRGKSFRDATFMGIMRWNLYNQLQEKYDNVDLTYGYITKHNRIQNDLPKEHRIDAYCIGGNIKSKRLNYYYNMKQIRKHNRQIHKANILKGGKKRLNQSPYEVLGFRLFDKVLYDGIECFIFGRRKRGYFDIRLLNGTSIRKSVSYKKLKLLETRKTILVEREECNSSPKRKI